ncbi:Hypothetical_protein [Hexamita inflata]|uniref:Hypothetical_protein n=1 Tax=Hexamita inflata TaxID=28002 RepID=A0AA86NZY1_9EUKA|nr:Hypothetical protein HINF_LOCUS16879 [Hexamita inflata]
MQLTSSASDCSCELAHLAHSAAGNTNLFHFQLEVIQTTGEARGVTHFLARSRGTALRGGVSWLASTTEFQTNDSGGRGLKLVSFQHSADKYQLEKLLQQFYCQE